MEDSSVVQWTGRAPSSGAAGDGHLTWRGQTASDRVGCVARGADDRVQDAVHVHVTGHCVVGGLDLGWARGSPVR